MYYDDHNPPHFHALYSGNEVEVGIDPLAVLKGKLPRRALGMVMEWRLIISRSCSTTGVFWKMTSSRIELIRWTRS